MTLVVAESHVAVATERTYGYGPIRASFSSVRIDSANVDLTDDSITLTRKVLRIRVAPAASQDLGVGPAMWIALALGSAFLAAVLGTVTKVGLEKVDPTLALAIQGTVMSALTWAVVAFGGNLGDIAKFEGKTWPILLFAGALMLAANLLYYRALGSGPSSGAQPIDRLSLVFAVILAALFLKEKTTPAMVVGVVMMAIGAIMVGAGAPKK